MENDRRALAGVRVLDLGTFIAAPFCGTLLAEFGADVLKIEHPGRGDPLRTLGVQKGDIGLLWLQEARNKRGMTCDLHSPAGQQIVRDLVAAGYDIVLESFRPGTLERWDLGYERLREVDPGVILARVSGYGQDGPGQRRPGFGRIAQAFSGLTYLCGFPDRPPANPGTATLADYIAGLFAAYGVLVAREYRARSGRGQVIDVALYESVFRVLDSLAITYSATGAVRQREGTGTPLAAPHNHYPTANGQWVAIACTTDQTFARLASAIGHAEWVSDPRFVGNRDRVAHRDLLDRLIAEWTGSFDAAGVVRRLEMAEVPCSTINSIADAFADPQFKARGTLLHFQHEVLGALAMPTVVPRLSDSPGSVGSLGPSLGQDTDDVLCNTLGYSGRHVRELHDSGAV